jgi:tRNA(fMet)-specific endonuclease VapC
MIILDSDILTLFFSGHDRVIRRVQAASEPIVTTVISWCEIIRGRIDFLLKAAEAQQVRRASWLLERSEQNLAKLVIVRFDESAAAEFDRLRLDRKLRKIGRADLLIAAIALTNQATLVSRNLRHFRTVAGLRLENWAD